VCRPPERSRWSLLAACPQYRLSVSPTTTRAIPDTAAFQVVADHLDHTIAHGEPEQAKALLAILIAEPRVSHYTKPGQPLRQPTHGLRAAKKMEPTDLKSNRSARLAGGRMSLDGGE
jgi:hypothetical protein